ncbi:GTP cyclohydrolase FolE2 [Chitinivorax sp. PXF-14]|uniref:GTP cyclohydrolase FolE2 n=1 Tax=Chitinivorax sp. PXF-14 TaxID=3230488 RepID=UPI00346657E3
MNAPERLPLPDIQSLPDVRNLAITAVGVKDVRYPLRLAGGARPAATVGTWSMSVGLPAHVKGTHMSRFIELLTDDAAVPLDAARFTALAQAMLTRLDADSGTLAVDFPYFIAKAAPVSGVESLLDHQVTWRVSLAPHRAPDFRMRVMVPATSLCPCSKEISAYGAHNQRSHIGIEAQLLGPMTIETLVAVAEQGASCEVYGLLKRSDEKYVTERAYDNPKFVEDLVRDIALALEHDSRIGDYRVEAENFESIHNHSAYALIERAPH